ncbi:FRG domain-containing protein [Zobellella denitrificans]
MYKTIKTKHAKSIPELIELVQKTKLTAPNNRLYFRGENQDFGASALTPGIYRTKNLIKNENTFYREITRFNDKEFIADNTAFDRLSRMQHYLSPTRLLDLSEDILSALHFALEPCNSKNSTPTIYLVEINLEKSKYYDSDAVSVVANLAKSPLSNNSNKKKSKKKLCNDAKKNPNIKNFNKKTSVGYLLHDIREEKSYFSNKIKPEHLFSIFFVHPKLNNSRITGQKGAYLLFGLSSKDPSKPIRVFHKIGKSLYLKKRLPFGDHPIANVTKVTLSKKIDKKQLEKLGFTLPYLFPEMDKVSTYLKENFTQ